MEIADDQEAMDAIAYLKDHCYSLEQVLLAMCGQPAGKVKSKDLLPWPVGTVVRETKTGYCHVLSHALPRSDAYEFVCERAHGEKPNPDYSYICNSQYCRCRS